MPTRDGFLLLELSLSRQRGDSLTDSGHSASAWLIARRGSGEQRLEIVDLDEAFAEPVGQQPAKPDAAPESADACAMQERGLLQ